MKPRQSSGGSGVCLFARVLASNLELSSTNHFVIDDRIACLVIAAFPVQCWELSRSLQYTLAALYSSDRATMDIDPIESQAQLRIAVGRCDILQDRLQKLEEKNRRLVDEGKKRETVIKNMPGKVESFLDEDPSFPQF